MRASVTVSIALDTRGICTEIFRVTRAVVSTSLGTTSDSPGNRRTSSKVSPKRPLCWCRKQLRLTYNLRALGRPKASASTSYVERRPLDLCRDLRLNLCRPQSTRARRKPFDEDCRRLESNWWIPRRHVVRCLSTPAHRQQLQLWVCIAEVAQVHQDHYRRSETK